jgi:hypothetical protein
LKRKQAKNTNLRVRLQETKSSNAGPYSSYHLVIEDIETDEKKVVFVADLERMGGGISLKQWKVTKKGTLTVLSAFLEISILGHDLDQWRHYDLATGNDLGNDFAL